MITVHVCIYTWAFMCSRYICMYGDIYVHTYVCSHHHKLDSSILRCICTCILNLGLHNET